MTQTSSAYSWRHAVNRIRSNLLLIALAGLAGAVLGILVASAHPTYQATALLGVRTSSDVSTETAAETAAVSIVSPAVIQKAAAMLDLDAATLGAATTADVESGTALIRLTSVDADPDAAVRNVTTVAEVSIQNYVDRSAAIANDVRDAGEKQLGTGALSDDTAEKTRTESIGSTVGLAQGQSITGSVTISIVSPALGAYLGGVSKPVGAILGATFGVLLTLLLVLSGTWRLRRKVRTAADLEEVPGARLVLPGEDVAGLTGAVLASSERYVVIAGAEQYSRLTLSQELARGLRRNGYSVSQISVLETPREQQPLTHIDAETWSVGREASARVLAHSERRAVREVVNTDLVLVDLADLTHASEFLAGQADFVPILVVSAGTRYAKVMEDLGPVQAARPILVISPAMPRSGD